MNSFIVDCDTGRDDALALWICCLLDLPLKAVVCSYGNTPLAHVVQNNADVLGLAGRDDIPLWVGAEKPSRHHIAYDSIVVPRHVAGGNGICDVVLPAHGRGALPEPVSAAAMADNIRAMVKASAQKIDYVILGPATNFAAICAALGDDLADCIGTVYMGGGKFAWMWPQVPGADFNVVADPFAVKEILSRGVEIHFVPMDVLFPVFSTLDEIKALEPKADIARYAREIMMAHAMHFSPQPVFRHIDPATILSCLSPEGFEAKKLVINLDEASPDYGRLIEDETGYRAKVYRRDEERFVRFKQEILKILGF